MLDEGPSRNLVLGETAEGHGSIQGRKGVQPCEGWPGEGCRAEPQVPESRRRPWATDAEGQTLNQYKETS